MWCTSTEHRHVFRLAVLIALVAIVPHLNSLRGDFTFDDVGVICDNPMITGARATVWGQFTTVFYPGALYRPLTMLSYLANARLGGGAAGYHLVNVCLHAMVTILAFVVLRALLGSTQSAALSAALFAVHPIHTEAVTSIVGRAELLAAFMVLLSLFALIRAAHHGGGHGWLLVSYGALAAGLLSKESAFTAIPLCLIGYLWSKRSANARETACLIIPYVVLGAGYLGLRALVVGSLMLPSRPDLIDNPLAHVPALPRLETALVVLWQYLAQLVFPLRLSADYSFNEIPVVASPLDPRFLGAAAVVAGLAIGVAVSARRAPVLSLAAALTVVPLMLTANVLFPIGTIKAERLMYLPSLGWCVACGWLATHPRFRRRRAWLVGVSLVVVAYAGRTWVRNRDWRDNFTLFAATVHTSPDSAKVRHNLAVAYEQRGDIDAAMLHFREALAIFPAYDAAAFGIGKIYEKKGLDDAALDWYAKATQLNWQMAKAHLNIGLIRYRRGQLELAATDLQTGLEAEPNNPRLLIGLSMVRLAQGDRTQARAMVDRAASFVDGNPEVAKLLGEAHEALEKAALP